jgi:hypothetical protein
MLDSQNNPNFDLTTTLVDGQAVEQAVYTRLSLWYGEWWENLTLGLPVTQQILSQLASPRGLQAMSLLIQQQITAVPYVTAVVNVVVTFANGQFNWSAEVQTFFGTVTVTNLPGQSASLDT